MIYYTFFDADGEELEIRAESPAEAERLAWEQREDVARVHLGGHDLSSSLAMLVAQRLIETDDDPHDIPLIERCSLAIWVEDCRDEAEDFRANLDATDAAEHRYLNSQRGV